MERIVSRKKIIFWSLLVLSIAASVITLSNVVESAKFNNRPAANLFENDLDIVYGSDTAEVTIYLFSNYTCKFCSKFFNEVYPELKKEYIEMGKIKLVVKPVALTGDESVINSLKLAICLNKYGNLEKLNELLLLEPQVIYSDQFNDVVEELTGKDEFVAECMLGGEAEIYLSKNLIEFKRLKCTGTPTFVINNKIYKGYVEYNKFKKVVEKELQYALH